MKPVSLRLATREDIPAIEELHKEHQEAQGTDYELPDLGGPTIEIVLVGTDEDGVIRNCVYVERVAELRTVGCDARATAFSWREIKGLAYILRTRGYRFLECFPPRKLKKSIAKPLKRAGFKDKEEELSYFSRDLRG